MEELDKGQKMSKRALGNFDFWIAFFLIVVTAMVYWDVQYYEFVNFDDMTRILWNKHITGGLTAENLGWAVTCLDGDWIPATRLSHMLDCQLYGLDAGMHHVTNVILHLANTLLLFFLLKKMTGASWRSGFVAALFACHPLHVESVAWVSERKDVLSAFFWFLTMGAYLRYVDNTASRGRYFLIMMTFVLGLMCKPMLVTLPLVLIFLDYWPLERFKKEDTAKLFLEKVPLIAASVPIYVFTCIAVKSSSSIVPMAALPVYYRTANAIVSWTGYIRNMFWPVHLACFYPFAPDQFLFWKVATSGLLLSVISIAALWRWKRDPYLTVGWLWYIVTLLPVIGLMQVGSQRMADRYTYIPSIGLFIMISWGLCKLAERQPSATAIVSVLSGCALVPLAAGAKAQVGYWRDGVALFGHAISIDSNNAVAQHLYADALNQKDRLQEAVPHYLDALRIAPSANVHSNLAYVLTVLGRFEEAQHHYLEALKLRPGDATLYNDMEIALARQKSGNVVRKEETYFNLGVSATRQGRNKEAIAHFFEALRIRPDFAEAHYNMGVALVRDGQMEAAEMHFREALRLAPNFAQAREALNAVREARK